LHFSFFSSVVFCFIFNQVPFSLQLLLSLLFLVFPLRLYSTSPFNPLSSGHKLVLPSGPSEYLFCFADNNPIYFYILTSGFPSESSLHVVQMICNAIILHPVQTDTAYCLPLRTWHLQLVHVFVIHTQSWGASSLSGM
jgi:hypothetical protein